MARQFSSIIGHMRKFMDEQRIFFAATAAPEGRVNVSPKGMDSLRVLGSRRIVWRNLTGSGNETAGHLLRSNRMTLMWCGFSLQPMILRAYGSAHAPARFRLGGTRVPFPARQRRSADIRYGGRDHADLLWLRRSVLRPQGTTVHLGKMGRRKGTRRSQARLGRTKPVNA